MHVSHRDRRPERRALARNAYNSEFPADASPSSTCSDQMRTLSGDRSEFLGRNGSLPPRPRIARWSLSGKVGAALDPMLAMQVSLDLATDRSESSSSGFGSGATAMTPAISYSASVGAGRPAQCARSRATALAANAGHVQVDTPEPSRRMC
jgi:cyclic beta-1,2-glucan synthetase